MIALRVVVLLFLGAVTGVWLGVVLDICTWRDELRKETP